MKFIPCIYPVILCSIVSLCAHTGNSIDPWKFLEYKLITTPKSRSKLDTIIHLAPAYAGGITTSLVSAELIDYLTKYTKEITEKRRHYASLFSGVLGASFVYSMIDAVLQKKLDMEAIHSFIVQWPEYKKYTPEQLYSLFDDVYQAYIFDPHSYKYYHNALDALTIARNHIYYQFPNIYGHLYKKAGAYTRLTYITNAIANCIPLKIIAKTLSLVLQP